MGLMATVMTSTSLQKPRSVGAQVVTAFTGVCAYHGSTRPRRKAASLRPQTPVVAEMRAASLDELDSGGGIDRFDAVFPNRWATLATLPVPSQEAIQADTVSFCWCPLEQALQEAGPVTKRVLVEMREHLEGHKRYVYIDSKIQYFDRGDVPVDSQHWHVDGSITARGPAVWRLGHGVLNDMKARLLGPASPPTYLSYQSSQHCATLFAAEPVALRLPTLIPNFDELDRMVRALNPACASQPAAAIVRFDGLSLHRAVTASDSGWRLWIRCVETDRQVQLDTNIIECYDTVFRPRRIRTP
jgi:hypothetical protein